MKPRYIAIALILGVIVLLALETHREGVSYSGASPYNTRWDGVSNLVEQLKSVGNIDVVIVENWVNQVNLLTDSYSCGIIFLVSPEKSFTSSEVEVISKLVIDKRYNLVILDEGPNSNSILKTLGMPVGIEAYKYVESLKRLSIYDQYKQLRQTSDLTPGFVELNGKVYYILFSYVSPVTIGNNSSCSRAAYVVGGITVGAICRGKVGGSVLVIGDGSIAVNAVIPLPPGKNLYTNFINGVIEDLCLGTEGRKLVLLDASKYSLRVLTFVELVNDGYDVLTALALTLNPFRYLYVYTKDVNMYTLSFLSLSSAVILATVYRFTILRKGRGYEVSKEFYIVVPGYGRVVVDFIEKLCKSDSQCVKEVPCVLKKVTGKKCIQQLSEYMTRNRGFRRKVVETLLLSKQ